MHRKRRHITILKKNFQKRTMQPFVCDVTDFFFHCTRKISVTVLEFNMSSTAGTHVRLGHDTLREVTAASQGAFHLLLPLWIMVRQSYLTDPPRNHFYLNRKSELHCLVSFQTFHSQHGFGHIFSFSKHSLSWRSALSTGLKDPILTSLLCFGHCPHPGWPLYCPLLC